jgi:hypothetical protein
MFVLPEPDVNVRGNRKPTKAFQKFTPIVKEQSTTLSTKKSPVKRTLQIFKVKKITTILF